MRIACYFEGGIGDVLLGHKLAWALKSTIYPNAEFSAFLDTEGNKLQSRVLKYLFPSFYKEIFTIPSKKYKKLIINSQFGEEEVKGFIDNVPNEWAAMMNIKYDKWFNFHIDSLEYLNYPELQWAQYFRNFPAPETRYDLIGTDIIMSNIYSESGTEHVCEKWWADRLVLEIDKLAQKLNLRHKIISTPKLNSRYEEILRQCKNTELFNGAVEEVCYTINHSRAVIGIDSAWRLIGHFYNKPVITLSKNCQGRGNVPVSHQIRWLPFPETTFGLHHPTNEIIKLFEKLLENQLYQICPTLALTDQPIENILIKRNYKINEEKSILA